jgi:hypothetical protein
LGFTMFTPTCAGLIKDDHGFALIACIPFYSR